jgi:hypothetical protein
VQNGEDSDVNRLLEEHLYTMSTYFNDNFFTERQVRSLADYTSDLREIFYTSLLQVTGALSTDILKSKERRMYYYI